MGPCSPTKGFLREVDMTEDRSLTPEGERSPQEWDRIGDAITRMIENAVTKPKSKAEDRTEEIFGPLKSLGEIAEYRDY